MLENTSDICSSLSVTQGAFSDHLSLVYKLASFIKTDLGPNRRIHSGVVLQIKKLDLIFGIHSGGPNKAAG